MGNLFGGFPLPPSLSNLCDNSPCDGGNPCGALYSKYRKLLSIVLWWAGRQLPSPVLPPWENREHLTLRRHSECSFVRVNTPRSFVIVSQEGCPPPLALWCSRMQPEDSPRIKQNTNSSEGRDLLAPLSEPWGCWGLWAAVSSPGSSYLANERGLSTRVLVKSDDFMLRMCNSAFP